MRERGRTDGPTHAPVEACGRPRVRVGVRGLAAGICGVDTYDARSNTITLLAPPKPPRAHSPKQARRRTDGVIAADEPDDGADELEGQERHREHHVVAVPARHGCVRAAAGLACVGVWVWGGGLAAAAAVACGLVREMGQVKGG